MKSIYEDCVLEEAEKLLQEKETINVPMVRLRNCDSNIFHNQKEMNEFKIQFIRDVMKVFVQFWETIDYYRFLRVIHNSQREIDRLSRD